jgi:DNA-binding response OmpR family regulator
MEKYNILLVDDDPYILEGIGADLENQGFQVTKVDSGDKALQLLQENTFDLVITDLVMENTDGIQVLKNTKALNVDTMVIILTGYGDMKSAIEALRQEADDYLLKPCESAELLYRVNLIRTFCRCVVCVKKSEMTVKQSPARVSGFRLSNLFMRKLSWISHPVTARNAPSRPWTRSRIRRRTERQNRHRYSSI